MAAKKRSNEIHIHRVYDAPVKAVWEAWTDPDQVAKWWGPRGFTITTHSKDLKAGGHWNYTMHGPDGVDYPNKTKYYEVEKYAKLLYDHGGNDEQAPLFRVTTLFSESRGKTSLDMSFAVATPEAAEDIKKIIKMHNGNSTWDRLAEYLEKQSSGAENFVINRSFDAPIDLMYEMWSDPKHFSQWLAPTGFEMKFLHADIQPGGSSSYVMTGPGITMYGRANYIKMEKPRLLVYTQEFCDEKGNLARHPMAPTWPATMLTTVLLTEEGPDSTRVTITWEPYGSTSAEELATFIQARAGMTMGWTGSFDKLEAFLLSQ